MARLMARRDLESDMGWTGRRRADSEFQKALEEEHEIEHQLMRRVSCEDAENLHVKRCVSTNCRDFAAFFEHGAVPDRQVVGERPCRLGWWWKISDSAHRTQADIVLEHTANVCPYSPWRGTGTNTASVEDSGLLGRIVLCTLFLHNVLTGAASMRGPVVLFCSLVLYAYLV
jgi:hypothetical protein